MPKSSLHGKPGGGSRQIDVVPVVLRTRLTEQDQRDLRIIWNRDQRIPTPASRQKWAQHRGLAPTTVGRWFSRRRASHIPLAGDEAAQTGSYELNPRSPSNVAPHEIPVKAQVRGSRAYARARGVPGSNFGPGSERTDPSSDDIVIYHPGRLDQGPNLAAATETVTVMNYTGLEAPPPGRACACVLCVSGALGIFETLDARR